MKVFITKRDHFPQRYLAQWMYEEKGYSSWFHTLKDFWEYISEWNAEVVATNFMLRR